MINNIINSSSNNNQIITTNTLIKFPNSLLKLYTSYLKNKSNKESDAYILNLVSINHNLFIPDNYTRTQFIDYYTSTNTNTNTNATTNTNTTNTNKNNNTRYKETVLEDLQKKNKKQKCNICLENYNENFILTPCFHSYCFLCFNKMIIHNTSNKNNFNLNSNLDKIKAKSNENQRIKCPTCQSVFKKAECKLIFNKNYGNTKSTVNEFNHKVQIIKHLFKKENEIRDYLSINIGFKTVHVLENIDNIIKKYSSSSNYFLVINQRWIDLMKSILNKYQLNRIGFLDFDTLSHLNLDADNNDNNDNKDNKITIFILEPLNLFYRDKLNQFTNQFAINKKTKLELNHLVIKNTIDQKIAENKVILN